VANLEDYALKSLHLAKMTGVMMGVHAIRDSFLLMHTGVGCKYKTASQIAQHDWATHPNKKEGWTQVGDRAVIKGSSERIGVFARSWAERRNPGFMAVVSALFLELTGEDFSDAVRKAAAEEDFPCPMQFISTGGAPGDFFSGYGELLQAVAKSIDWSSEERRSGEVSIMGHMFTRYEADQRADVAQIKGLLKALGLAAGPIFLSGSSYAELGLAAGSEHNLAFPYASKKTARRIKKITGREWAPVHLPIGIAGTSRWLREVTELTGADKGRCENYIEAQTRKVRDQASKIRERYAGQAVAVIAEAPLAAGLCSMLDEFGFRPMFVGIRDQSLGNEKLFRDWLERDGVTLPEGAEVIVRPSLRQIRERFIQMVDTRDIAGVFASSTDLNLFQNLPMRRYQPWQVQVGFPTTHYHVTYAIPTFGYAGVVSMAQRILDRLLNGHA
jgi:nitrogenase molybdenum-iron protein alpha/beta subunit